MTVYRPNPLLMTVMGANPGGPAFIVIDSLTGRVMYTKRATGVGSAAINSCAAVARKLALRNRRSYIVFLDMSRKRIGDQVNLSWVRAMGITEEVHPDGSVTRGNPPRRRRSGENEIDTMIGAAWARFMSGVQVSIMEIPKIFRDIKLEMSGGMTLEDAVRNVGNRYRVNRNPGIGEAILGGVAGALASRAIQPNPSRRTGGLLRNNPAISRSWDSLKPRPRLAILEFAGIPYEQARRLAGRAWATLPPSIQDEVLKGWQENPRSGLRPKHAKIYCVMCGEWLKSKGPYHTMKVGPQKGRVICDLCYRGIRSGRRSGEAWARNPAPNPGPRGKRRMTMTIERFAAWVKSKRDPAMWKAFLAKFKGYENWTHGARARKVTVEWVDAPGVNGLWITYDGGKQPESTYIMPKGSKRKGAWKHPWETMPDIKHDPQAGIVITKLRGQSKITDFYHR